MPKILPIFFVMGNASALAKIQIILYEAGYQHSTLVKDIVFILNIELHYLLPYSPNLNLIIRLWKFMNKQVRNNEYFANIVSLKIIKFRVVFQTNY